MKVLSLAFILAFAAASAFADAPATNAPATTAAASNGATPVKKGKHHHKKKEAKSADAAAK